MTIIAQYQTYYGVELNHWNESWGNINYNKLLVKEMPDDEVSEATSSTTSATSDATVTFLYPLLVANKYYVDGICDGHVKICNSSDGDTPFTISEITFTLKKIDNVGNETDLASTTTTNLSYSVATDFICFPFYMNVSQAEVDENEKLAFSYAVTTSNAALTELCHGIDTTYGYDIKLRIPYAPEEG